MLMSDLPANSQIKNTRKKETKRQKRVFAFFLTLIDLISGFSLLSVNFCISDKKLLPSQNETVADTPPQSKSVLIETLV